jgi:hypothetical protein
VGGPVGGGGGGVIDVSLIADAFFMVCGQDEGWLSDIRKGRS